jgi:hypothetical protein
MDAMKLIVVSLTLIAIAATKRATDQSKKLAETVPRGLARYRFFTISKIIVRTSNQENGMDISTERKNFSNRLQKALQDAHYVFDSPTQLARNFNIRSGNHSITVHAARKWLVGEAIPTQDKLRTLAQWLGVSAEWLRFGGDGKDMPASDINARLRPTDIAVMEDLKQLDDQHHHIVREVIRLLIHVNGPK